MEKVYFTFADVIHQPYWKSDYVLALGADYEDCKDLFHSIFPGYGGHRLNCQNCYLRNKWGLVEKQYAGRAPSLILVSEQAYGCKPKGFDPVWFYVPAMELLVHLRRTRKKHFIYDAWDLTDAGPKRRYADKKLQLTNPVKESFQCLADAIPYVSCDLSGDYVLEALIL